MCQVLRALSQNSFHDSFTRDFLIAMGERYFKPAEKVSTTLLGISMSKLECSRFVNLRLPKSQWGAKRLNTMNKRSCSTLTLTSGYVVWFKILNFGEAVEMLY